ncbi:MAG: MetQ/NlpA family ABC transporter substrate-binding protein [Corynebacterium sp.]|nr:MetQ/NlpA family ABC transporter substrate-binding protein [Corynebacterium sp.]
MKRLLVALTAATLAVTGLSACSNEDNSDVIRLGSTDSSDKAWTTWVEVAKENDIDLEIVNFADYSTPNQALSQGKIDANQFQHLKFLSEYVANTGENLVPVGSSEIVPLNLYWKGHDNIEGIEGESIAIPNDPTNQGRAINVLAAAGLLTLLDDGLLTPTPADIDKENSVVEVTPVDAAQTPAAYGDGQPAVININFLERADIDPNDAVFKDEPDAPGNDPYINVLVTTEDNKDNPDLQKLVELWHSDRVQEARVEDTRGAAVPVERTQEELQDILDELVEDIKSNDN